MYTSCGKCKGGYIFDTQKDVVRKCECLQQYQRGIYLQARYIEGGLVRPQYWCSDYIGKEEIKKKLLIAARDWKSFRGHTLILRGKKQTQKTTQAKALLASIIESSDARGVYIEYGALVCGLLAKVRGEEERMFIDDLVSRDVIVIDGFLEKYRVGSFRLSYFFPLLEEFFRLIQGRVFLILVQLDQKNLEPVPIPGFVLNAIEGAERRGLCLEFNDHAEETTTNLWEGRE